MKAQAEWEHLGETKGWSTLKVGVRPKNAQHLLKINLRDRDGWNFLKTKVPV